MALKRRVALGLLAGLSSLPFVQRIAGAAETPAIEASPGLPAERVLGIGGVFFRSRDPEALSEWYRAHLGILPIPMKYGDPSWRGDAGTIAFAPFPQTTKYFTEPQAFMLNFRVRDLEKMAAQLEAAGVPVKIDLGVYPNGRFARLHDPEGNAVELWQPKGE